MGKRHGVIRKGDSDIACVCGWHGNVPENIVAVHLRNDRLLDMWNEHMRGAE